VRRSADNSLVYRLDDTLGFSIHKAAVRLRQALGQHLRPFDLTPEQFGLLGQLWEQEGLSQRELADRLFKDKPTVTRMLEKLDQRGLVHRCPDHQDRRVFRVFLTATGRALEGPILHALKDFRAQVYAGIDPDQQERIKSALDLIVRNIPEPRSG
jgi:DNA-binding MarR family transcriptional regulator